MSHRIATMSTITGRMKNNINGRNFTHSQAVISELDALARAAEALDTVYKTRDPYQTQAYHDRNVSVASNRLAKRVDAATEKVGNIIQSGIRDIEARIAAKTKLKPGVHDQEIRQIFRSKTSTQQIEMLRNCIENGDSETLSALLIAPTSITGLAAEMVSRFKEAFEMKQAPEEFEERSALMEDFSTSYSVMQVARQFSTELLDPKAVQAAEIAKEKAVEANAAFESTVNTI